MSGWIKLHRSTVEWEWYSDHNTTRLFIHLLMKANHKEGTWKGLKIPTGSLVTGSETLRKETGLSRSQIRTSLGKLKMTNEIAIKATNKYSIIEVKKWKEHQVDDQQNDSQHDQQPDKRIATNKKNKKVINNVPDDFLEQFNKRTGRSYRVLSDKVLGKLNARIKEGFTIDEIYQAAENAASSDYHKENRQYLSPEFISRDDKLQVWMNKGKSSGSKPNGKLPMGHPDQSPEDFNKGYE